MDFLWVTGGISINSVESVSRPLLYLQDTPGRGRGVFASSPIAVNSLVIEFGGEYLTLESEEEDEDHMLQIDHSLYLGPSGGVDDYINHSCEPNTVLKIIGKRAFLFALKDIAENEEIFFDYSTSMSDGLWEIDCLCGAESCRGRIQDFVFVEKSIQDRYIKMGMVPRFILECLESLKTGSVTELNFKAAVRSPAKRRAVG